MHRDVHRIRFIDGIRGFAALQVVLMHYTSAFYPAIGSLRAENVNVSYQELLLKTPLLFLFDGYIAVYSFFLISGVALTHSFAREPSNIEGHTLRRIIRLGLPMGASMLLAFALIRPLHDLHLNAAQVAGSTQWFGALTPDVSFKSAFLQLLGSGMFVGYDGIGIFSETLSRYMTLVPLSHSLNPPLWTLHIELFGSFAVMLLVAIRAAFGARLHQIVCGVALLLIGFRPLSLFVVGHLMAHLPASEPWRRFTRRPSVTIVAVAAIGFAVASSSHHLAPLNEGFVAALDKLHIGYVDRFNNYGMVGALFLFSGLMALPRMWRWFETGFARFLGKISFSLYLTHFPILLTLSSGVYLVSQATPFAAAIASSIGVAASFAAAILFEHWIDRPAVALSRRIGARFGQAWAGDSAPRPAGEARSRLSLAPAAQERE